MDPVDNPFRPGAGRRPPLLAGRDAILAAFDVVRRMAVERGEGDRSWVLTGLRGVGKTALVNELTARADRGGWITAKVEATSHGDPLEVTLSRALVKAMRTATGRHPVPKLKRALGVLSAFTANVDPSGISVSASIDPVRGVADTGRFALDLAALFDELGLASRELGIGTLIVLDELQEAEREHLAAINEAVHAVGQAPEPYPLVVVAAGLPSLPAQLAEANTYAERLYDFRAVGLLDRVATAAALIEPTESLGVTWAERALAEAVRRARGYPYFVQSIGKHVWDVAPGPRISLDDVQQGLLLAQREVDEGLYVARWDRSTPAQRALLRAMATCIDEDEGAAPVNEVARAAGKTRTSDISVSRRELMKKGLVYAPERGLLAFTVPGMGAFIARQADE